MVDDKKYAGFWLRFAANMVDSMWLTVVMFTPIIIVIWGEYLEADSAAYIALYLFSQFILPAILVLWFWQKWQATPGKMVCGIKVVDAESHEPPGLLKYSLRYVGYFISMIPLCLGYFWVGWDSKKRGFHDYLSKTVVIHS
ncbi:RDD family protein [Microbulbifer sp. JMSA004]|uniref:RDD family protein n=1 Tax=unclassified Microbulbifer TaxID=2619833 RepID=UPI0024AD93D9|nr:RDD family protein [Microbulbifer sp. VAAF005]WHI47889.1 RDD family protein [Microbulbifer sp. VAAF005]